MKKKKRSTASSYFHRRRRIGLRQRKLWSIVSLICLIVFTALFLWQIGVLPLDAVFARSGEAGSETSIATTVGTQEAFPGTMETEYTKAPTENMTEEPSQPSARMEEGFSLNAQSLVAAKEEIPLSPAEIREERITRIVRTLIMYLFIIAAILLVRYLYEGMNGDFFSNIIAILAAVILSGELLNTVLNYFIHRAYEGIWQRVLFALSLVSMGSFVLSLIWFYPMSTRLLTKSMKRRLLYSELAVIDWVRQGDHYKVDVVKMDSIPQSADHISSASKGTDMHKTLRKFCRKATADSDKPTRMILIGGFGSGKSTALLEVVQDLQRGALSHRGNIPVYVKLREWLDPKTDMTEIGQNGENILRNEKQHEYMKRLFKMVTASTEEDSQRDNSNASVMQDVYAKLHEERRLVYVFDGMNELLQRKGSSTNDVNETENRQFARNVAAFLYRFASGNPCVISMCSMRKVITTRTIILGDPSRYVVYAVKGVALDRKDTENLNKQRWMRKLVPYVSLYRLAESDEAPGQTAGTKRKGKTVFQLLQSYAQRQINYELIDKDKVKECKEAILRAIEHSMRKNVSEFLHSPYSGLTTDPEHPDDEKLFRHMSNSRLLYSEGGQEKEPQTGNGTQESHPTDQEKLSYHASHILILEYMLAEYAIERHFFPKDKKDEIERNISFIDFFCGSRQSDGTPNILELTHLRAVFAMVITEVYRKACLDKIEACNKYFDNIVQWIDANGTDEIMKKENRLSFLLLLSEINDDLHDLGVLKESETLFTFRDEPTEASDQTSA